MTVPPSFACPCCGAVSFHPADIGHGYCGRCRWQTGDPLLGPPHLDSPCPQRWTAFTRAEVIKPAPGRDFYVAWSHIVEAPTWAGTRAEALAGDCTPDRLDRADENGSSWHLRDEYGHAQPGCWWTRRGLVAEQLGYLPRAKLAAYVTAYCQGRPGAAYAMLERFGDMSRADHLAGIKLAIHDRDRWRRPRRHRRCKTCHPELGPRPLAVDGHEYQRRLKNRRKA